MSVYKADDSVVSLKGGFVPKIPLCSCIEQNITECEKYSYQNTVICKKYSCVHKILSFTHNTVVFCMKYSHVCFEYDCVHKIQFSAQNTNMCTKYSFVYNTQLCREGSGGHGQGRQCNAHLGRHLWLFRDRYSSFFAVTCLHSSPFLALSVLYRRIILFCSNVHKKSRFNPKLCLSCHCFGYS